MRERALTLLFALGALALFYVMFLRSDDAIDALRDVTKPITTETRRNGYFVAAEWLENSGVRVESLRDRYTSLVDDGSGRAASGNLLIVTMPAEKGFLTDELRPLDRWVRRGNTLLVLAALIDKPDWSYAAGGPSTADLRLITGLDFVQDDRAQADEALAAQASQEAEEGSESDAAAVDAAAVAAAKAADARVRSTYTLLARPLVPKLVPSGPHLWFDGVRRVSARSDYRTYPWHMQVPYETFALALARDEASRLPVLWTRVLGEGRIVVLGYGTAFTNRAIGSDDNARLFANLVRTSVGAEGRVLFDDFRHGVVASYDSRKFYADGRLYATLAVLLALWFVWVLGATRLRVPVVRVGVPREAELVRITGSFLARVLRSSAGAMRLIEQFLHSLRVRAHGDDAAAWRWLESHPRIALESLATLRRYHEAALAGRRVPLVPLRNLLLDMESRLS